MFTPFKHTIRRLRGQIIGWSIGLALYGLLMTYIYGTMFGTIDLVALMQNYPQEFMAFFGGMDRIGEPAGFLDLYFFGYMPVIVGIFAIGAGASLLVSHEEQGILDLILAHPISRTGLFWGRFLGYASAIAIVLVVSWLSWLIPVGAGGLGLPWNELLLPYLPLLGALLLFGALSLLLSLILPSSRLASMLSAALLVGNYLMAGLSNMNADLKAAVEYLPLHYVQGGDAMSGLKWDQMAIVFGAALLCASLAWLLFLRRDIRVGGERSWSLPGLRRRQHNASAQA
jgi:ABC-2 type transport system permease protein